jgi:hypothetical protein
MNESPDLQQVDLKALIGHTTAVQAEATRGRLPIVRETQCRVHCGVGGSTPSRNVFALEIGMLLGSRYGFSLFSRKPVREHLLPCSLNVHAESPLASILEQVASRSEEAFYDDALLVDEQGSFLRIIFTRTLVQFQHRFLRPNIERLEEKQREINAKNVQMPAGLSRLRRALQIWLRPSDAPSRKVVEPRFDSRRNIGPAGFEPATS